MLARAFLRRRQYTWQTIGLRDDDSRQNCGMQLTHVYSTRSKNACLQGHFCDVVNIHGRPKVCGDDDSRRNCGTQLTHVYYNTKSRFCQVFFDKKFHNATFSLSRARALLIVIIVIIVILYIGRVLSFGIRL